MLNLGDYIPKEVIQRHFPHDETSTLYPGFSYLFGFELKDFDIETIETVSEGILTWAKRVLSEKYFYEEDDIDICVLSSEEDDRITYIFIVVNDKLFDEEWIDTQWRNDYVDLTEGIDTDVKDDVMDYFFTD